MGKYNACKIVFSVYHATKKRIHFFRALQNTDDCVFQLGGVRRWFEIWNLLITNGEEKKYMGGRTDKHHVDPEKNVSFFWSNHENEVLPQDTMHLVQRPCYQRGSTCQDPAGNRTTRRPPDHRKETQTAVVWSCLPFIRSGHDHLARHRERGKKTRQTEEEVGRRHQGMDRP